MMMNRLAAAAVSADTGLQQICCLTLHAHESLDVGANPTSQQLQADISHLTDMQQHADVGRRASTCRPALQFKHLKGARQHARACWCQQRPPHLHVNMAPQRQGGLQERAGDSRGCVSSHSVSHFDDSVRLELLQILRGTGSWETGRGRSTIWQNAALVPTWSPAQEHKAVQCRCTALNTLTEQQLSATSSVGQAAPHVTDTGYQADSSRHVHHTQSFSGTRLH